MYKKLYTPIVWVWWPPNDTYFNDQSLLIEEPLYLSRRQSFSFQTVSEFSNFMSRGEVALTSLFCPRGGFLVHSDCPGGGFLPPSSRFQRVCSWGGGLVLDEIDRCITLNLLVSWIQQPKIVTSWNSSGIQILISLWKSIHLHGCWEISSGRRAFLIFALQEKHRKGEVLPYNDR